MSPLRAALSSPTPSTRLSNKTFGTRLRPIENAQEYDRWKDIQSGAVVFNTGKGEKLSSMQAFKLAAARLVLPGVESNGPTLYRAR